MLRKIFITRLRLYFIGTAIFMVTFIHTSLLCAFKKSNLSCYDSQIGDALPSAEDPSFSPKAKSIFFHETSCRGGLTVRQACAVEAAARAHPRREIYVLFSAPVTDYELKTSCLAELLFFNNVKFLRLHAAEYSKGTAVQKMLLNDLKKSKFQIQHIADILRILTLNKWGGIYLDTDTIVTKSLDELPSNFVAKETKEHVASGILSFAKDEIGTNVTNAVIKEISKWYNPERWSVIGSEAIEAVLRRLCPKNSLDKLITDCKGVIIFDRQLFYPIHYEYVDDIFYPAPDNFDLGRPYTYHTWNHMSFDSKICKGSIYELIAKAFCPTIHSKYYDEFSSNECDVNYEDEATSYRTTMD